MLIQQIWQVVWYQWDHRNNILHWHKNLVTLAEVAVIANRVQEELAIGIQGIRSYDKYLFQEHRVTTALDSPIEKENEWLDSVSVAQAAYIANLKQ
jgi:hypothetical protein